MIYLLTQMVIALCVAAILGGAIGWLVHRANQRRYNEALRQALARQQRHLTQAQNEMATLAVDYDELKAQSNAQIEALKEDNEKIPSLSSNLEKSQLLVRQLIQKQDVKHREMTLKNDRLATKIKQLEEQAQLRNSVEAELSSMRRERAASDLHQQSDLPTLSSKTQTDDFSPAKARYVAAEALEDPFDEVMEVGDELQQALESNSSLLEDMPDSPLDDARDFAGQADAALGTASADIDPIDPPQVSSTQAAESKKPRESSVVSQSAATSLEIDDSKVHLQAKKYQNPPDEPIRDSSPDTATLFELVDQQDDLQQIFGIGPVTEKALNKLGITSYAQLAELKHHEIQKIADALEIVPGRIERDNWVGNARRQLEEVLEQL
ncbi:MAG: hypothetical protein KTR32_15110 [Granulosicoccus sp.]|nr:hypothetical protein [Granulosicoccus sp.]